MKNIRIFLMILIPIWVIVCFVINECSYINEGSNASNEIVGDTLNQNLLKDSVENITLNYADIDRFMSFLIEEGNNYRSWIERKEIASWSAALLLFSILMLLFKNIDTLSKHIRLISVFIIFLLFLFCLFIHQQFGALTNGMAIRSSINVWIYKAIQENEVPTNFDFTLDYNIDFPKSLQKTIRIQQDRIRSHCFPCRVALPYVFILHKIKVLILSSNKSNDKPIKEITTIEMEEAILYNILIITAIVFLIFIKLVDDKYSIKKT